MAIHSQIQNGPLFTLSLMGSADRQPTSESCRFPQTGTSQGVRPQLAPQLGSFPCEAGALGLAVIGHSLETKQATEAHNAAKLYNARGVMSETGHCNPPAAICLRRRNKVQCRRPDRQG
jgi:hypothetical protein